MKVYSVYLVDSKTNKKALIGKLTDRRKNERDNNAKDMLRLAKKMYSTPSNHTKLVISSEILRGVLLGTHNPSSTR